MMDLMRASWTGVLTLVFALVVTLELHRGGLAQGPFKSFMCAGSVMLSGANPYLVEPLRSCEQRLNPNPNLPAYRVEPAPLPGYALVPFAALSKLPVKAAQYLFTWASIAALALSAWQIGALTGFPRPAVLLGLLPLGYLNIAFGEIPPIMLAAIATAGFLIARKQWVWASVAASVSMIEPHVGLATCLAMFVLLPRCRIPLAVCAATLGALSVAVMGVAHNVTYFHSLLPSQAVAELAANDQYSLSRVLYIWGVSPDAALVLGGLSFLLMLAAGIFLGRNLAMRLDAPELIAWFPAAAALLAGSFVHDIQMIAALPAAFAVAARTSRFRGIAFGALVALSFVWTLTAGRLSLVISITAVLAIALVAFSASLRPLPLRLVATAATVLMAVAWVAVFQHVATASAPHALPSDPAPGTTGPDVLSSIDWGAFLRATPVLSVPNPGIELLKVPTWAALVALVFVALVQVRRRTEPFRAP